MRCGKLAEDNRPGDLRDWKSAFSSVVHYQVLSWAELVHHPAETDVIAPTACVYCKRKVEIPAEFPLLQVGRKCGGRRKSVETEGTCWRVRAIDYDVEQPPLSWITRPSTPILFDEDKPAPTPLM